MFITRRHNQIRDDIVQHVRMAGGVATPEPAGLDRSDNRRPDVLITLDNHMYIIDVSIAHPTCITHLRQHSYIAIATRYKYTAMAEQHGMTFVPFVMDTLSGLAMVQGSCTTSS